MTRRLMSQSEIVDYLELLDARILPGTRLYLVGECSLVLEGWRDWTDRFVYDLEPVRARSEVERLGKEMDLTLLYEPPQQIVPLPPGAAQRARPWRGKRLKGLTVSHYDPYSTAFRLIARGDEPDYFVVMAFLERGWIQLEDMEDMQAQLLPRFTAETIHQDPAEFRRKYKGLRQMWKAVGAAA